MNLSEIKEAITKLSPEEAAEFSAWYQDFHAAGAQPVEQKKAPDVPGKKLDEMTRQAVQEFRQDQSKSPL